MDKEKELKLVAQTVRKHIVEMVYSAQSGHPGGSLSSVEIMVSLFFNFLNIKPDNPDWEDRDRFVLSKGHASPVYYAILAEKGFFPKEELLKFRKIDSFLQGHPSKKLVPGVDASTGSLGQGLSIANGMAMAAKMDKKNYKTVTLLGDGEMEEGQIWEALMAAGYRKLDNLIAILDYNGLQIDGEVAQIKDISPIKEKIEAFNWDVIEIDGHSFTEINDALLSMGKNNKPLFIIAHTIKGKGVSFMENNVIWHGKAPTKEEFEKAMEELNNG